MGFDDICITKEWGEPCMSFVGTEMALEAEHILPINRVEVRGSVSELRDNLSNDKHYCIKEVINWEHQWQANGNSRVPSQSGICGN